jgi:hypothetical protein
LTDRRAQGARVVVYSDAADERGKFEFCGFGTRLALQLAMRSFNCSTRKRLSARNKCKTVMNDIEIRSDMGGVVGWAFRVPLRATKHIRCASCGADVARENWTITDPQ